MAFTKMTGIESVEVLSPEQHDEIEVQLHALGKTSARDLTDEQREALRVSLATSQKL